MNMKLNKRKNRLQASGLPWILPALIFLLVIIYYSIIFTINLSTRDWNGLDPTFTYVGSKNFAKLIKDRVFWQCLRNTLKYFVITFVVQNGLGFIFAAMLHSNLRLKTLHKVIIFIPTILAPATMAPVFRLLFSPQGLLQKIFDALHLGVSVNWLANPKTALYVLMWVAIWEFTGMSFILYFAAMSQIDKEMLEAARIDGASNIRTLITMVFPLCKGTTISMAMLGIIGALKTFDIPYLITTGGPNHATEFLGTYIYRQGIRQSHLGYAAALSVVLLVLAIGGAFITYNANKGD